MPDKIHSSETVNWCYSQTEASTRIYTAPYPVANALLASSIPPTAYHFKHLMSCWSRDTEHRALLVRKTKHFSNLQLQLYKNQCYNAMAKWLIHFPSPYSLSSDTTLCSSQVCCFFFFSFPLCPAFQEKHTVLYGTLCSNSQVFPFAMDLLTWPTRKHLPFLIILTTRTTVFQYRFPWQPWIMLFY